METKSACAALQFPIFFDYTYTCKEKLKLIKFILFSMYITVKGKECTNHNECVLFQSTSCVRDPEDHVFRCLCGNNKAPINGHCKDSKKGKINLWCKSELYLNISRNSKITVAS